MNYADIRAYLLGKPEAVVDFPFGLETTVFKVRGKMFAVLAIRAGQPELTLKCDPDTALALRDLFAAVRPGYHMNKRHWNSVALDNSVPGGELALMMDRSYSLVVARLPKAARPLLTR